MRLAILLDEKLPHFEVVAICGHVLNLFGHSKEVAQRANDRELNGQGILFHAYPV